MAEELQHLINRIHAEAIQKAEAEATEIVAKAKDKAAALVRQAEENAKATVSRAQEDATLFVERGTKTLEQAARDLLITVGQGVGNIMDGIVAKAVDGSLDIETLKKMMLTVAQAYTKDAGKESRIAMLVSPQDQEAILKFFADQYRQKLVGGVDIRADNTILKGFKVRLVDQHVEHQFTNDAIAAALSEFLRPQMAEIVQRAARTAGESKR